MRKAGSKYRVLVGNENDPIIRELVAAHMESLRTGEIDSLRLFRARSAYYAKYGEIIAAVPYKPRGHRQKNGHQNGG